MKAKYVLDEVEPSASMIQTEDRKYSMRKLIKEIVSVCSIYNADFRNKTAEDELGTGEKLSGRCISFWPTLLITYKGN